MADSIRLASNESGRQNEKYDFVKAVESNARTYASTFESVFRTGAGVRIWDEAGREWIDCIAGAGALPLGHNDPEVGDAVLQFLSTGHVQQALDLTTPAKYEFLRELLDTLPGEFASRAKVQFCSPSGSDAVEAAMKLTRFATQRYPIIAFHGAYHGMTTGPLCAMGNVGPKTGIGLVSAGVHFAPFPYRYRCPFGTDGTDTDRLSINYLRNLLADPESGVSKPAAVIVEVVQGEGGCIPASDEWLRALRAITKDHAIPLVIDEVQSGFGRTGHTFAFERAGVVPDVLVLSKAIGGGYPLAIVVYDKALDVWPRGMHAGTFRGNQIAMVAGKATMQILKREKLHERADAMGSLLMSGLREIANTHVFLGDVRGRGLMIGVEVVQTTSGDRPPQDGNLAKAIKLAAFKNGLLLETGGRQGAVLRLLPPLILGESDVGAILDRIEAAVNTAAKVRVC